MAVFDGFFDFDAQVLDATGKYDREYSSEDFTGYYGAFIGSGVCVYKNPDSMKVSFEGSTAWIAPGYLFIVGYWLANVPGPDEDPETFQGYSITLPSTGEYAIVARLDLARSLIELTYMEKADSYPDCLVLAYIDSGEGTVTDTREDINICGKIDALGDLSAKVQYAVNYIDNEVEARLEEARQQIEAQEQRLNTEIAKVAAQVEKLAPPAVGTVKFTASQKVGPEWLRCDGSFISEADYPELVAALGKLTPGVGTYDLLVSYANVQQMSNVCLYNGMAWTYLLKEQKLIGVNGTQANEISVSGVQGLVQLAAVDTVLSVCGGAVYLAQNNQSQNSFTLLECESFTGNEVSIEMTSLDTNSITSGLDMSFSVPNVVDANGKKLIMLGVFTTTVPAAGGAALEWELSKIKYAEWTAGDFAHADILTADFTPVKYAGQASAKADGGRSALTMLAFEHKNSDEALFAQASAYNQPDPGRQQDNFTFRFNICSLKNQVFGNIITEGLNNAFQPYITNYGIPNDTELPPLWHEIFKASSNPALNIIPIAGGSEYIYRAKIENRKLHYISGRYNPKTVYEYHTADVQLPSRCRLFKESVCYASAQGLWFVFVGTGLMFCETLEGENWGYLDTQDDVGVITQCGCLEYDEEGNALYISGVSTGGAKLVRLQLPPLYNYANDGAWLPHIASDGVPAYIKAKEPEESGAV